MSSCVVSFNSSVTGVETSCYERRFLHFQSIKKFVKKNVAFENLTILLHGSYATGEITEYSDIDILAIYPKTHSCREEISSSLRRLSFYIHRKDPLMHHGIDTLDSEVLSCYDESVLPLDALSKACLLYGDAELGVSPSRELGKSQACVKLVHACQSILAYDDSLINRTPYKMKCLVSIVLLVPVLLLQADAGEFIYKREALARARVKYGSHLSFEAIDIATAIRENWKVSRSSFLARQVLIPLESKLYSPLWLQRISGAFYPEMGSSFSNFLRSAKKFSREILTYAEKNNIS